MGRLNIFLAIVFCGYSFQLKALTDTTLRIQHIKSINGSFNNFSVDNLGNIFLITATNQIKKLNNNFDSVGIFNDVKRYGNIYTIDVSNPLKVLVYYKDFATIVMLGQQLNNRNSIQLRGQNIFQVKAIAQSYDNNIWLFDEVDNTLKKIDESGNLLLETSDFRLLFEDNATPQSIIDMNGLLYLYNSKKGWTVFDYYGGLKNQYPITDWQDVQVTDNYLRGHDSIYYYMANPKQLQYNNFKLPTNFTNAIKLLLLQNKAYVLTKEGLEIYSIQ
ncbi:hypothetical protein ACFOW1_15145 [Parasediminibacterium paludis]|uniref:Uncharacterized protein n=1 Tax=Parasediminibacterium paludis TaxID=908966 RepID=A0ABV8Q1W5_9BACT